MHLKLSSRIAQFSKMWSMCLAGVVSKNGFASANAPQLAAKSVTGS